MGKKKWIFEDDPKSPTYFEEYLAHWWRDLLDLESSAFDVMLQRPNILTSWNTTLGVVKARVSEEIFLGRPLYFAEYWHAVGAKILLTSKPYVEFFQYRWHENKDHMGYGIRCCYCPADKKLEEGESVQAD